MIKRELEPTLKKLIKLYPVVSLTGPRQSGKSTLLQFAFPDYKYVSLEDMAWRQYALDDPKGFLEQYSSNIIIDEAQHAPHLFSYLQLTVDKNNKAGRYILSGSQNFLLSKNISQSLAGRVGIARLLPLSYRELVNHKKVINMESLILAGGYPRIYDKKIPPRIFYADYIDTYLDKDVHTLLKIRELSAFRRLLQIIAVRVGGELNISALSRDVGVSVATISGWLSVLQASYVIYLLPPYYQNLGKRLTKSSKIYFYDTGLLCNLIGLDSKSQFTTSDLRGRIFENFIISEVLKNSYNKRQTPKQYYWRDSNKNEIDLILEIGGITKLIELKLSLTAKTEYAKTVKMVGDIANISSEQQLVIYTGNERVKLQGVTYTPWQEFLSSD
jgi:predicted AAA+ superfamily ATPase